MGRGCANVLFWLVVAGVVGVFLLLGEHRGWAALLLVVTCGLGIAHNAAESQGW